MDRSFCMPIVLVEGRNLYADDCVLHSQYQPGSTILKHKLNLKLGRRLLVESVGSNNVLKSCDSRFGLLSVYHSFT